MKTPVYKFPGTRGWFPSMAVSVVCGGLLMAGVSNLAAAASPAGTVWDCTISGGGQKGLAFLTFSEELGSDGYATFSGYQLLTTTVKKSSSDDALDHRTPNGSDVGRTTETESPKPAKTNLFGFSEITGPWTYDASGKVIGSFVEKIAGDLESGTNAVTTPVSFRCTVTPGKRLTMVASTPNGRITFNGVPYREMPDLSGSWYAVRKVQKQSFLELFTLTSFATENPLSDVYPDLGDYPIYFASGGQGPGYNVDGFCMVSSRKQIGFAMMTTTLDTTNGVLNATLGSLSSSKGNYKTKATGVQEPLVPISFEAVRTAAPAN